MLCFLELNNLIQLDRVGDNSLQLCLWAGSFWRICNEAQKLEVVLKVLAKELCRSIDKEEIRLLCFAELVVELIRTTCILEDRPST